MADNLRALRSAGYRFHAIEGGEYSDADIAALTHTVDVLARVG